MKNELIPIENINNEVIEGANKFVEFLSSDTVANVRPTITVIPNIIKDILNVGLEHKELKIKDRNLRRKEEIAKGYLEVLDKHSQRNQIVRLEEIRSEFAIANAKVANECTVQLEKIKTEKEYRIAQIKSNEAVSLSEIKAKYEIEMQKINEKKIAFSKSVDSSNRQFDRKMKNAEKIQEEFTAIINSLTIKMKKSALNEYELNLYIHLTQLKMQALLNTFDLKNELIDFFGKGY